MKLAVQGIEEIELTDPQGLCNPPAPQLPQPYPPNQPPWPTSIQPPTPMPTIPWGDPTIRPIRTGDVAVPHRLPIYTRHLDDATKWGVGGEAIQRAGQQVDPDKFEKNWNSSMGDPDGD